MAAMNDFDNRGFLQRNIVWIVVLVAVIIFGFLLFKGWDKIVNEQVDSKVTITGNFSCLPRKTPSAQEECNLGVRSRDGLFYGLDISRIQDANRDLKAEDTIAVTGTLKPASSVSDAEWTAYNIAGVIKVNTLLRTR
jgi:hypothetical protein